MTKLISTSIRSSTVFTRQASGNLIDIPPKSRNLSGVSHCTNKRFVLIESTSFSQADFLKNRIGLTTSQSNATFTKFILGLSLSLKVSLTGAFGLSLSISVRSLSIGKTNASLGSTLLKISHRIDSETLGIRLSGRSKFGLVIGPNGSDLSLFLGEIRNSIDLSKAGIDLIENRTETSRKSVRLGSRTSKCKERIFIFNTRSLSKGLNTLGVHQLNLSVINLCLLRHLEDTSGTLLNSGTDSRADIRRVGKIRNRGRVSSRSRHRSGLQTARTFHKGINTSGTSGPTLRDRRIVFFPRLFLIFQRKIVLEIH